MKLEYAQAFEEALSMSIDVELRKDYSGRGMFGDTTAGIVVESFDEFLTGIGDFLEYLTDDEIELANKVGKALMNIRTDNMGLKIIIY